LKPTYASSFAVSAAVASTSPGCIGLFSTIAFFPHAFSSVATKYFSGCGALLPMLNTRNGALAVYGVGCFGSKDGSFGVGGFASSRTTPSTTSSTYVKSRRMLPLLNSWIGSPFRIFSVKIAVAMSGRPHGPYTVKKAQAGGGHAEEV